MVILEKEGADGSGGEEAAWGEEQSQLGHSGRREAGTQLLMLGELCDSSGPWSSTEGGARDAMSFSVMDLGG